MISWIIKTEVCVTCRSWRLRQITQTRGFDNSWYHAKTEFSNCFIIHFLNNRQKKTFSHSVSEENIYLQLSRYCIYHVKFTSYFELIECSRPIRFFIVSLMYNNITYCSWLQTDLITPLSPTYLVIMNEQDCVAKTYALFQTWEDLWCCLRSNTSKGHLCGLTWSSAVPARAEKAASKNFS